MIDERPEHFTGSRVWQALTDAIARHTELQPAGEGGPFEGANVPAAAEHRTFLVEPVGPKTFHGRMRAEEDDGTDDRDIVLQEHQFKVEIRHSYDMGAHGASWKLATLDAEAVEDALLVRPEALWCQPVLVSSTPVRKGHTILQTLLFNVTYERLLPPSPE